MRGAIIAAGGPSRRMGRPKALLPVLGVPLVLRVVEAVAQVVQEIVIASKAPESAMIRSLVPPEIRVVDDERGEQSPLVALITGARAISARDVAYLGCDHPLLAPKILEALFEAGGEYDAAIPRWPDGRIEPMVAVYGRERTLAAAIDAVDSRRFANTDMISRLPRVRYVPTEDLRWYDPHLDSFVNVNSPADVAEAEQRLRLRSR